MGKDFTARLRRDPDDCYGSAAFENCAWSDFQKYPRFAREDQGTLPAAWIPLAKRRS
jgi:hypothetical protein